MSAPTMAHVATISEHHVNWSQLQAGLQRAEVAAVQVEPRRGPPCSGCQAYAWTKGGRMLGKRGGCSGVGNA